MEILLLTTPTQHRSENPAVELNPKILQQWTRTLPVTDVVKTVETLSHAIEAFNELLVSDKDRLRLLEIYYEAFDHILQSYDELRLRQLPLTDIARQSLSKDIMWLYLHLANGYKIIVNNTFRAKRAPKLHPPCITAIYRAIQLISLATLYAARSLKTIPPLTYLELNQLYLFAQCADLLNTPLRKIQQYGEPETISRLYKQFLLQALSNVDRGTETNTHDLYMALERFADQARISNKVPTDLSDSCYLIDYFEDQLPKPIHTKIQCLSNQQAILDITPCLDAIENWLQKEPTAADAIFYENERKLLPEFIHSFNASDAGIDDNRRNDLIGSSHIIVGLDQVLQFLNEDEIPNLIRIEAINTSSCIEITNDGDQPRTCRGEIVGLIKADGKTLNIGVIEHVDYIADRCIIQLRMINGKPEPVFYRLRKDTDPLYGLYFPKSRINDHASLLAVKALLNHHASLMVSTHGSTYTVKTGECLFETSRYAQFRFTVLGKL